MKFGIAGVGVIAAGIENWREAQPYLDGSQSYDAGLEMPKLAPSLLPANERRRTTKLIKLALQCGQDAVEQWQGGIDELATVFASSGGDLEIVDRILSSLCLEEKPVSPTHFHNSVHNAPAGYWSIAARARGASTSISAFDSSFATGLLEAGTQVVSDQRPLLLVAYDIPPPQTLMPFRPLLAPFATALVLVPSDAKRVIANLDVTTADGEQSVMDDGAFEALRVGNPAARALPLLQLLAEQKQGVVQLPLLEQLLSVEVTPC